MNLRLTLTIVVSKIIIKACRIARRGGTTLPGRIARFLCPDILNQIAKNFKTIMVTGTNGKTTTTRIIGKILDENGIGYITNKSGANLVGGIITTFIDAVDIHGKCKVSTALIEIDEAAFKVMSNYLSPDILVVTNFFRDQLDRYGELYTTLKGVKEGIVRSDKTHLILNADDSLCASLGRSTDRKTIYFGFALDAYKGVEESINSDAMFCLYCKQKYEYSNHVYGHLGGFRCTSCGYSRPETDVTCTAVEELTSSSSVITYSAGQESYRAKINLPGLYNIYNALAAIACGTLLGFPPDNTVKALGSFECGFGRMEAIDTQGKTIKLILVKNPTGFNQVLNYLLTEDKTMQLAFIINDRYADGTDISWLWDVDFEKLQGIQDKLENIYTSGLRGEDMAVRLKYAGIYSDRISIVKEYKKLVEQGLSRTPIGHSFYILPTYTAMLDIRKLLKDMFSLKDFWK
ncbi:MAG: MurT ligase domain-containing protein [Clostridia bacterium]|nr:MurT ligase domain-containing protein [Clostridia bacterium]